MFDNTPETAGLDLPGIAPAASGPLTRRLGLDVLFAGIAAGAAERDSNRELPYAEIAALKEAGLGALRLPVDDGGQGLTLAQLFAVGRDLAVADSNIAHAFRNHLWQVEAALQLRAHPFHARVLALTAAGRTVGLSFTETDAPEAGALPSRVIQRIEWDAAAGTYLGTGKKVYATGNLFNDAFVGLAVEGREERVVQYLFERQPGVGDRDDWGGFGQRLTGSGTAAFDAVRIAPADVHDTDPPAPEGSAPWRFTFHQVWLTNCIAGIARRILLDAQEVLKARGRNFYHGASGHPAQEPVLLAHLGRIRAWTAAIEAVVNRAVEALDHADRLRGTAGHHDAALAATLAATEAKVVVDDLAPQLAGWLIDLGSGSVVSQRGALDRHWRNIKVIASHNPRLYKEEFLGRNLIDGKLPPTGAFF